MWVCSLTLLGFLLLALAVTARASNSPPPPPPTPTPLNGTNVTTGASDDVGQTALTIRLNELMAASEFFDCGGQPCATYRGGNNRGVIFRTPDDEISDIVAASMIHNDVYAPVRSYVYTNCDLDGPFEPSTMYRNTDPYTWPVAGIVVGENLGILFPDIDNIQDDSWDEGVFYGTVQRSRHRMRYTLPPYRHREQSSNRIQSLWPLITIIA